MVSDAQRTALEKVVEDVVKVKAHEGMLSRDELVDWCAEMILDTGVKEVEPYFDDAEESGDAEAFDEAVATVSNIVERAAHRFYDEVVQLGDSEDVQRLEAAFAELEEAGIIVRQALGHYLRDCAERIHHEEIPKALREGKAVRGFATFDKGALEQAVPSGTLDLAYGAVSGQTEASLGIAEEVLATLVKHGVKATWSGSRNHGIRIPITLWRRVPR